MCLAMLPCGGCPCMSSSHPHDGPLPQLWEHLSAAPSLIRQHDQALEFLCLQEFEQMRWSIEPLTYRFVSLIWHSFVWQRVPVHLSAAQLAFAEVLLCH